MTALVPIMVFGVLLIALLILWARSGRSPATDTQRLSAAIDALSALRLELLPPTFIERVFSPEDCEFISTHAPLPVQRLFYKERRAIALTWLRQTRGQLTRLMRYHLTSARANRNVKPASEALLAANYFSIILASDLLELLVRWQGPFRTRRMAFRAARVTTRLCDLSQNLVPGLDLASPHAARSGWSGSSTVT